MKKSKFRSLKRLLVVSLVLALLVGESTLTVSASIDIESSVATETNVGAETDDSHTLVIFDEEGKVTYETVTEQNQRTSNSKDAVIVNNMKGGEAFVSQDNNQISTFASDLSNVSVFNVTQAPYKYSCIIISRFPDGTGVASSGILVGKNIVLASGHGVYEHEHGGEATSVMVGVGTYYTSNGEMKCQFGSYYKKRMILDSAWVNDQKDIGDWALITLPEDFDSYQLTGYAPDYKKAIGRSIRILGYPGERFCTSTGTITGTTDNLSNERSRGLWTTSACSEKGMSGGPLIDEATGAVIGIVKGKDKLIFGNNADVPLRKLIIDAIHTYSN